MNYGEKFVPILPVKEILTVFKEKVSVLFVGSLKFVHNSWSNSWEGYNSGIYYGHDGQIKKY